MPDPALEAADKLATLAKAFATQIDNTRNDGCQCCGHESDGEHKHSEDCELVGTLKAVEAYLKKRKGIK